MITTAFKLLHLKPFGWQGLIAITLCALAVSRTQADEVQVAVAANFSAPMQKIAEAFAQRTGHQARLAVGSTGKFAAQIRNGAPFEVLLAADQSTAAALEAEGLGVKGQRFTYAIGKLVLYSAQPGLVDDTGRVLKQGRFQHVAVADPKLAPYGAAGLQALGSLGLLRSTASKLVLGENITQTFQFVQSGNAELGFVALSQVIHTPAAPGSYWVLPQSMYSPIRQDALLLKHGEGRAAAQALMKFLRSDEAKAVIRSYGYDL